MHREIAGSTLVHLEAVGHTFVAQVDDARYATLAYAEVDLASGEVLLAAAGHMPPVIVEPDDEARLFMDGRSPPLGAADPLVERAQARLTPARGAGFLLYTDGLVERRTETIDDGLDRLLEVVREGPWAPPADLAEALIEPGTIDDDVCLLSFRLVGGGRER